MTHDPRPRKEDDDPSPVGRRHNHWTPAHTRGCVWGALLLAAVVISAVIVDTYRWQIVVGGLILVGVTTWLIIPEGFTTPDPARFTARDDWSREDLDEQTIRQAALVSQPFGLPVDSLYDGSAISMRISGAGSQTARVVATRTRTQAENLERGTGAGYVWSLLVWAPLRGPLPALDLLPARDAGVHPSESFQFNERFAVSLPTIPVDNEWRAYGYRSYASALLSPRVMEVLLESFPALPAIRVRGDTIGAVLGDNEPYRAELTAHTLSAVSALIERFVFDRYAQRAAQEGAPAE